MHTDQQIKFMFILFMPFIRGLVAEWWNRATYEHV
jgi:hypothetical protein